MTTTSLPVAILVRVSTARQETDRQVSELAAYAEKKGYVVLEVCRETVSGKVEESERDGLTRALQLAQTGQVKKILVHEVSRIARKSSIAHRFVESLEECRVSLYWHQQGIETLLENGKRNPAAAIMFALLAEMARSERETLVDRIRSGLAEARKKGKVLGRPKGTKWSPEDLAAKHKDILRLLKAGNFSLRQISSITKKSKLTVQRVKAAMTGDRLSY